MNAYYPCPHCDYEIECDFIPSRPAPLCSNHDHPNFSDPGNGAECDLNTECPNCGEKIDIDKALNSLEEKYADRHDYYDGSD